MNYIAAQGPVPGTVFDFWRMVWYNYVTVIVMVCRQFELGKVRHFTKLRFYQTLVKYMNEVDIVKAMVFIPAYISVAVMCWLQLSVNHRRRSVLTIGGREWGIP